jgi:3-oxoacyl-[acyl-carrier-protein] synthase III
VATRIALQGGDDRFVRPEHGRRFHVRIGVHAADRLLAGFQLAEHDLDLVVGRQLRST